MNKKIDLDKKELSFQELSFDEIIDLINKIHNELINLDKQIKSTPSTTLKKLLTKNYIIGSNIFLKFKEIFDLYKNYIEYSSKHSQALYDTVIKSNEKTIENIKQTLPLLEKTKFEDIKRFCISTIEHQSYLMKQTNDIIDFNETLDEFIRIMTLNMIYLSVYNYYLPFTINDYNKYKIIKESVKNIAKTIIGFIPILSEVLTAVDFANDITALVSTFDDEYMREAFFKNTNDDLLKIEKQTEMLNLTYNQQNSLIEYLKIISEQAKENYEEISSKSEE